jgi:uncharacterized protein (DUF2141 family)
MVVRKTLILLLPLILGACAQVGFITGGDRDIYAPAPKDMVPTNESVNFTGNSFEITFDEFVQLNNPLQNVVIVPDHANLKTTLHHKTVRVEWEETLKSNTTYVVYFNGAVEDVTENNDSLMTYVFSTGQTIDSISYSVGVLDAYTNQLAANMTVGLFTDQEQDKPYYFAKTDASGKASFRFLAAGSYYLRAFQDVNNDMKIQPTESIAFRNEPLVLERSLEDSIALRMFSPLEEPKLTSLKPMAPGALVLEANTDISKASFNLNGSTVSAGNIKYVDEKKVLIFTDLKPLENAAIIVRNTVFTDTITTRLTERDKTKKLVPVVSGGKIGPHQALAFEVYDLVSSLDTALITLTDPDDSSKISLRSFELTQNILSLDIDRDKHKRVEVSFKKGAIRTTAGMDHDEFKTTVDLLYEKDFGILHIDASGYSGPILLELLKEKTVVQTISLNETKLADIQHILPGEYQIRVITDADQNGKWSSGDLGMGLQPERVDWFTVPKIRANWEVDILLSPER